MIVVFGILLNSMKTGLKKSILILALCVCSCLVSAVEAPLSYQVGASNLPEEIAPVVAPFAMPQFKRPDFPKLKINIAEKGAKPMKLATSIIQKSIEQLSRKGGGTVVIPRGKWLTGRIIMRSNINLYLEEGAELYFSGEVKDYLPVVFTRNEGIEMYSLGALIYANGVENIAVTGSGKLIAPGNKCEIYEKMPGIDGNVEKLIPDNLPVEQRIYDGKNGTSIFLPMFFAPINSKNILVEGVTFEKSIFWNIVPQYCENIIIRGVTVNSVGHGRTDGIDIESSRNVLIEYVTLSCGDDCFTIKSGRGEDGLRVNKPSENIVIRYCNTLKGSGGVAFGSETAGMIRNVYVHDCVFEGVQNGLYIKTRRPRGGGGESFYFERIRMSVPGSAFMCDMLGSKKWVGELASRLPVLPVTPLTPVYRNIVLKDIVVENCHRFIHIIAIPESPLAELSFTNINATCKELMRIHDVDGLAIKNAEIEAETTNMSILDSRNIVFEKFKLNSVEPVQASKLHEP